MYSRVLKHCLAHLTKKGVCYSHRRFETTASINGFTVPKEILPQDLAFTVVYCSEDRYGMLVMPADRLVDFWSRVDFGKIRQLLGVRKIRLATRVELALRFPGCEEGAVPPFGRPFQMPVVLDRELAAKKFMTFCVGRVGDVIRINTADFLNLNKPVIADFTRRKGRQNLASVAAGGNGALLYSRATAATSQSPPLTLAAAS